MSQGKCLSVLFFLLLAPWCRAAEAVPADFSKGFKQLAALGLPPLPAGTKWSVLPDSVASGGQMHSELAENLKGNGWLLPLSDSGKQQAVLMGDVSVADLETDEKSEGDSPGLIGRMFGGGGRKKAADGDADLAKDVKTLRDGLEKLAAKLGDENDYRARQETVNFGRYLIFAAQIDQSGNPKLANELITSLFLAAPERETVIDAAITHLAAHQLEAATSAFFKSKDWKVYQRETAALVAKFPRGWADLGAAALLLEPLSKRAAGTAPAVPTLAGIELDPAAVGSIKWMTDETPAAGSGKPIPPEIQARLAGIPARYRAQYLRQMSLDDGESIGQLETWLLKKSDDLKESAGIALPTVQLGIAALPVLAALANDSYLTLHPNPRSDGSSYSFSYGSSDDSPTARALQSYASMNRPATRGDLAVSLLQATLPNPEGELRSSDPQELRDLALEFWKLNRNSSREKLALAFLKEGSSEQKSEAAQVLATSSDPADHRSLETHILEDGSPVRQIMVVKTYIKLRKSAAKPFLDLYVKALREEVGDGKLDDINELPWEIRELGSIGPVIKQLESQVSGKSPQTRAREIAKEDPKTARVAITAFAESLSEATPRKRLLAMLAGAVAAEDPEIRGAFIQNIYNGNVDEEKMDVARTIPPGESEAWKTLIADDRQIPKAITRGATGFGTMGDYAAVTMEQTVDPGNFGQIQMATAITGKTSAQIMIPRASARLSGQPIPLLPDATKVSPARLAEIVASAGTQPMLEVHPYLKTLTDDERAAWLKWYQEPGGIAIPENVLKLAMIVTQRGAAADGIINDTPGTMDIDIGFEVHKESVEKYIQHLSENIPAHSRTRLIIQRTAFPPGLQLTTMKLALPEKKSEDPEDQDDEFQDFPSQNGVPSLKQAFHTIIRDFNSPELPPDAIGGIRGSLPRSSSTWWIIGGKAVLMKPEGSGKDLLTTLADWTADNPFYLNILVLSRADADAIKESE